MTTLPIALAGIGKIAQDEHVPALRASSDWHLAATISRNHGIDGVKGFKTMDDFLADPGDIRTVSLALPPGPRFDYAIKAMEAGLNVMLEKPPAVTLGAARHLCLCAEEAGVSLYMTWHSRMGAACAAAADRLRGKTLKSIRITWCEDVRRTHPGQDWLWKPGNLGVYDPGINAFSILARILDRPASISEVTMEVPEGRHTPIRSDIVLAHPDKPEFTALFNWRYEGDPVWDMEIETEDDRFTLTRSGSAIVEPDGTQHHESFDDEYPALYRHMAELVASGGSETDLRPFEMTADSFLLAERTVGAPFDW